METEHSWNMFLCFAICSLPLSSVKSKASSYFPGKYLYSINAFKLVSKNGTCHSHIETAEEKLTLSWTVCRIFPVNPFSWPAVCFRVSSELSWLNSIASRPSSTVVNDPDNGARNSTKEIEWYLLGWQMLAITVLHEKWKLLTRF